MNVGTQKALPERASQHWWAKVQENIRKDEYTLAWRAEDSAKGAPGGWAAFNRAQGFDALFSEEGFVTMPVKEGASWEWGLSLAAWGRPGAMRPSGKATLRANKNRLEADRPDIGEWFVNDERGLEQGFTIPAPPPEGVSSLSPHSSLLTPHYLFLDLALSGTLRPVISEDGQAVDFYDGGNIAVIHYAQLKVTDATGALLPSRFEGFCSFLTPHSSLLTASAGGIRISVDDTGSTYPITVDPIATSPIWTGSGDADLAYFGASVATAGDVNGDGYSDIIVGVPTIGPGFPLGRAYVFLGSASGLSTTPVWTGTNDGYDARYGASVSTAGDVNGDGYSDILVGEPFYGNGNQGRAYVYLGSASGPSTTPAWIRLGEVDNALFGLSVATAGDVNGDGYSDIIIGAPFPPPAGSYSGRAYVYLGSASGLSMTPVWTGSGDMDAVHFGTSVATAGDVNGDGFSDILIGAPYHPGGGTQLGRAYVFLGSASGPAAAPAWTGSGDADYDSFGGSVATTGDVNGDGYSDILVGAFTHPASGTTRGRAYVFLGSASGVSATAAWTGSGDMDMAIFGVSLASAGDVNGDGYSDILVGAYNHPAGGSERGRAYLYLGSAAGLSTTSAWTVSGDQNGANLGQSVATAGDVNGDGYSDILVGAPNHPAGGSERGRAYVYLGSASGPAAAAAWNGSGSADYADFGQSVSAAGDVDGDGYSDVVVGASGNMGNTGKAYLYLGSASGLSATSSWTASGEAPGDSFGRSVATAGDVNGDGYSDVIVGALDFGGNAGKVYLYLGGPSGLSATASWTAVGETTGDGFGCTVATAGDVNGDGYSDVVVGAFVCSGYTGKAYVYQGGPSGLSATASWTKVGEGAGDEFGISAATAGDVNGDGYSDVILGADGNNGNAGKAYVYQGGPSGLSATASWAGTGEAASDYFGFSVATAGDVNGDGYSDVIVGAYHWSHMGKAYVFLGGPAGLSTTASWSAAGEATGDLFGRSAATAGDVNGDGYSDVVVGAQGNATYTGKAYLYLGSASGLCGTSSWTASGEAPGDNFGYSVATAWDVNGDGYSDLIAGAPFHPAGGSARGRAYLYDGNGGAGVPLRPRQIRADASAPIAPLGRAGDGMFRIASLGRTPFGRGDVKLEWQVAPLGGSFSPVLSPIQAGATWTDGGVAGASLSRNLLLDDGDGPYIWRARTRYRISTTPFQLHGPWLTPAANGMMETDLRSTPACAVPTSACSITSVTKSGAACTLSWQDPNTPSQRTGWNVRRSSSASLAKIAWPIMGLNVQDADPGAPDCQWTDATGDIPVSGVWYYQITAYNANCPAEGPF